MKQHFGLDRLIDYEVESISETTRVVNPKHRGLNSDIRRKRAMLGRRRAKFGAMILKEEAFLEGSHGNLYTAYRQRARTS